MIDSKDSEYLENKVEIFCEKNNNSSQAEHSIWFFRHNEKKEKKRMQQDFDPVVVKSVKTLGGRFL